MEHFGHFNSLLCFLTGSLISSCLVGDYVLVKVSDKGTPIIVRACVDSVTHATIAVLSWKIAVDGVAREVMFCGLLASLVDVDHFIMAKSFSLADAVSLGSRPPFHNSLLLIAVSAGIFASGKVLNAHCLVKFSWLFTVAWTSHHIRDGYRRGLWFGAWSTPPYPQWAYVAAIVLIPLTLRIGMLHQTAALPTLDV